MGFWIREGKVRFAGKNEPLFSKRSFMLCSKSSVLIGLFLRGAQLPSGLRRYNCERKIKRKSKRSLVRPRPGYLFMPKKLCNFNLE